MHVLKKASEGVLQLFHKSATGAPCSFIRDRFVSCAALNINPAYNVASILSAALRITLFERVSLITARWLTVIRDKFVYDKYVCAVNIVPFSVLLDVKELPPAHF